MGFIRGFLLVIVAVLLFVSFLSLNLFWSLSSSLTYDNVQQESVSIIEDVLYDNVDINKHIGEIYPVIQLYCQNNSDYVFSYEGYAFDIPCNVAMQGPEAIIEESTKDLIHGIYYADYDCDFIDCFEDIGFKLDGTYSLFLISEKAHDYWTSKLYLFILISLILSVLVFFLVEKKTNMPILAGSLLIVSSLPFIKLDSFLNLFSDKIFVKLLNIFFSQTYCVSIQLLIMGIVLLSLGIIMKFFKVGFFISNLISKIRGKDNIKKEDLIIKKEKTKIPEKNVKKGKKK
jgi:hypothetical protein